MAHEITFDSQAVTKVSALSETLTKLEIVAWVDKPAETAIYANIKGFGRKKLLGLSDGNYPTGGLTGTTLADLELDVKTCLGIS